MNKENTETTVHITVAVTVTTQTAVIINTANATVRLATRAVTVNHVCLSNFTLMYCYMFWHKYLWSRKVYAPPTNLKKCLEKLHIFKASRRIIRLFKN